VVLDNPVNGYYGGIVSAPIFSAIARRWVGTFPTIAARIAPPARIPERSSARVPNVAGLPVTLAAERLRAEGLVVADGASEWVPVSAHSPGAGEVAELEDAVELDIVEEPAGDSRRAPDLRGLGARQAVAWLAALGARVHVVGAGAVVAQSALPGRPLPAEVTLTLR
jgi:cell division protein FtsI (penicillin-binding protein 3)